MESRILSTRIVRDFKDLDPNFSEWKKLATRSADSSLYVDAGWFAAWRAAFGGVDNLYLVTSESAGTVDGILPLVYSKVWRRPWFSMHHVQQEDIARLDSKYSRGNWFPLRQIAPLGRIDVGSVRGGWLVDGSDSTEITNSLFAELADDSSWDVLVFPAIEDDLCEVLRRTCESNGLNFVRGNVTIPLFGMIPKPWAEYCASRTRHFRKRMAAAERDLAKFGTIQLITLTEKEELHSGLKKLFELSMLSRKARPREGQKWWAPLDQGPRSFLSELVEQYVDDQRSESGVVVHQVNVGESVAAMLLSIVVDGRLYAVQTFFDPHFESGSPGRILMKHMLSWAHENNISWVDLNGNSSLVRLFAKEETIYRQVWVFNRTARAKFALFVFRNIELTLQFLKRFRTGNHGGR